MITECAGGYWLMVLCRCLPSVYIDLWPIRLVVLSPCLAFVAVYFLVYSRGTMYIHTSLDAEHNSGISNLINWTCIFPKTVIHLLFDNLVTISPSFHIHLHLYFLLLILISPASLFFISCLPPPAYPRLPLLYSSSSSSFHITAFLPFTSFTFTFPPSPLTFSITVIYPATLTKGLRLREN